MGLCVGVLVGVSQSPSSYVKHGKSYKYHLCKALETLFLSLDPHQSTKEHESLAPKAGD